MVFAVALRTTKNAHDAEDTTQAVFLTLAVQVKAGRPVTHLGPWLRQVATRTALDVRRARKRREKREHRHGTVVAENGQHHNNGNGTAKHHEVDPDELNRHLAEELARLPAKYRLPLISLYFGGMSREEIARELGCKLGTLGVRIHRGRQILARRLSERAGVPPGRVLGAYMATAIAAAVSATMASRTAETAARIALGQELG